ACAVAFSAWTLGASRRPSLLVPAFFTALCLTCLAAGRDLLRLLGAAPADVASFPLSFLAGFFLVNSALYALAWISPLGILADALAVVVLAAALVLAGSRLRPAREAPPADRSEDGASLACVLVSLAAATLWSQDSLRPVLETPHVLVFRPWIDSFYH